MNYEISRLDYFILFTFYNILVIETPSHPYKSYDNKDQMI